MSEEDFATLKNLAGKMARHLENCPDIGIYGFTEYWAIAQRMASTFNSIYGAKDIINATPTAKEN